MWFSYPWMQPVCFRLGTCPDKFPSSQHWTGGGVESLSEVLVHCNTQVTPEQPSGVLPLSAAAIFFTREAQQKFWGHKLNNSSNRDCSTNLGGSSRSSESIAAVQVWMWLPGGGGHKYLLKCGFLFSSTPLAWQWVCDLFTNVAMKTTVSWPSPESYCRRKLFVPVYSLTKGSQTQSDPPIWFVGFFFPTISPVLSRKWVPNMLETTVSSDMREMPEEELQAPVCVCTCVGRRGECVCDTPNTHTNPRTL